MLQFVCGYLFLCFLSHTNSTVMQHSHLSITENFKKFKIQWSSVDTALSLFVYFLNDGSLVQHYSTVTVICLHLSPEQLNAFPSIYLHIRNHCQPGTTLSLPRCAKLAFEIKSGERKGRGGNNTVWGLLEWWSGYGVSISPTRGNQLRAESMENQGRRSCGQQAENLLINKICWWNWNI